MASHFMIEGSISFTKTLMKVSPFSTLMEMNYKSMQLNILHLSEMSCSSRWNVLINADLGNQNIQRTKLIVVTH